MPVPPPRRCLRGLDLRSLQGPEQLPKEGGRGVSTNGAEIWLAGRPPERRSPQRSQCGSRLRLSESFSVKRQAASGCSGGSPAGPERDLEPFRASGAQASRRPSFPLPVPLRLSLPSLPVPLQDSPDLILVSPGFCCLH